MGTLPRLWNAVRTLAACVAIGLLLGALTTAILTAWSMRRSGRATAHTTMTILDVDGSNFITTVSADRWSTAAVIQLFAPRKRTARLENLTAPELHERLEFMFFTPPADELRLGRNTPSPRDNARFVPPFNAVAAPPRFLRGLSAPRTLPAGVWSETTYGWPMRCIAIPSRAIDAAISPFSAIAKGDFHIVPREAALSTALFAAPASVLALATLTLRPWWVKRRRRRGGLCPACAYPLAAMAHCPECGHGARP